MKDLEAAKQYLNNRKMTLIIVKKGKLIFETSSHGILGFLKAVKQLREKIEGASIADRLAGKAVALLCSYAKVKAIYAEILSEKAKLVLDETGVHYEYGEIVENILDVNKTGICPFERVALEISDPGEAFLALTSFYQVFLNRVNKK
ncbi:DUF1893 domain-containing protein [Candidatus Bathyarchaeota archaeon]|nr:DUF1893 domain-containing protein [Candidatus Bathyarchaeota archaeon]